MSGAGVSDYETYAAEVERLHRQVLTWMEYGTEQNKAGWAEHEARVEAEAEVKRLRKHLALAETVSLGSDEQSEVEAAIAQVRAVVDDPRATGGPMYDGYVPVRDVRRALNAPDGANGADND